MIADIRVLLLDFPCGAGEQADDVRLAGADVHVADNGLVVVHDLLLGPLDQREDLLGALAQDHALLREQHAAGALCAADQKLLAELLLHGAELGGKRWLRQVQGLGRSGDALLSGHRQKVL